MPAAKKPRKTLTPKQRRFVEAYKGNAAEAARIAGYSDKTAADLGRKMLRHSGIRAAIRAREKKRTEPIIATREERQVFWTRVMFGLEKEVVGYDEIGFPVEKPPKMADRIRAAELLGKSECDFIDKKDIRTELNVTGQLSDEERDLFKELGDHFVRTRLKK